MKKPILSIIWIGGVLIASFAVPALAYKVPEAEKMAQYLPDTPSGWQITPGAEDTVQSYSMFGMGMSMAERTFIPAGGTMTDGPLVSVSIIASRIPKQEIDAPDAPDAPECDVDFKEIKIQGFDGGEVRMKCPDTPEALSLVAILAMEDDDKTIYMYMVSISSARADISSLHRFIDNMDLKALRKLAD